MPYIGNSPGTGTRNRFIYTATASQTTFSGADDNGKTLKYADSDFVDVYLNGICLVPVTDYTSTSKTSIVLTQAASLNDTLEVVAYDIASIADTVSKADGGTFEGDLGITSASPDLTFTNSTSEDTDGGRESTITFKGKQSGGEESTLAQIQAAHDGSLDDEKGLISFKTNDGNDSNSPTERWRITSDGHFKAMVNGYGIDFSASEGSGVSSSILDDYEEGVHELVPNSNLTISGSHDNWKYTKIGRKVTMSGLVVVTSVSGSNNVSFTLPFTIGANPSNGVNAFTGMVMHSGPSVGDRGLAWFAYVGLNYLQFYKINNNATWSALTNSDLASSDELYFTATYFT